MIYLNVHGSVNGGDDGLALGTVVFVALLHRLGLPVGPVDVVLEDGHGEDVVQLGVGVVTSAQHDTRVTSVQVGHGDVVLAGVRPEQLVGFVRYRQSIRPTQ